jgi:hypothetical protein
VFLFDYDAVEKLTDVKIRTNADREPGEEAVPDWFFEDGVIFLPEELEHGMQFKSHMRAAASARRTAIFWGSGIGGACSRSCSAGKCRSCRCIRRAPNSSDDYLRTYAASLLWVRTASSSVRTSGGSRLADQALEVRRRQGRLK